MPNALEAIQCVRCHVETTVPDLGLGNDAVRAGDLPADWIVLDTYPPGDDGLAYACSEACARVYWTERDR